MLLLITQYSVLCNRGFRQQSSGMFTEIRFANQVSAL